MNYEFRWFCPKSLPCGFIPDPILQVRQRMIRDPRTIRFGENLADRWSEWVAVPFVVEE